MLYTETIAVFTGARRVVKGEHARLELADTVTALWTCITRREDEFLAVLLVDKANARYAISKFQSGFKGLRQSLVHVFTHLKAIYHGLDAVLFVFL